MSRFRKLSHVVWHCQYHIVWVPKYRYRVLKDRVGFEISKTIRVFAESLGCEIVELNVQEDHVHSSLLRGLAITPFQGVVKTTFLERGFFLAFFGQALVNCAFSFLAGLKKL